MKTGSQWRLLVSLLFAVIVLVGCRTQVADTPTAQSSETVAGIGGMGSGMMARHHASIPDEYAGVVNLIPTDEGSLERGGTIYATHCASCHGDGGMGDGPAGAALDTAPAAVAHTSLRMGDDYLYWRISEGGAGFSTSMPGWKEILDDQARWDVINYLRALGKGDVQPGSSMGGAQYDPELEAVRQATMLEQAVQQNVITQSERETFETVHGILEQYRLEHPEMTNESSSPTEREAKLLAALVEEQTITQDQADAFITIHDRLAESGLMP
jgi:mono/diheme cytochrome c family protein